MFVAERRMDSHHTQFHSPFGALTLERYSRTQTRAEANLQAWDAADGLLLQHLADTTGALGRVLVLNDSAGALACSLALAGRSVERGLSALASAGDSWISAAAARRNLTANQLDNVQLCDSLSHPFEGLPDHARLQPVDWLIGKLPKSLRLFADQLARYRPLIAPHTQVVFAGMVKHMSAGYFNVLEEVLGPTRTSLAEKKARLIFADLPATVEPVSPPDASAMVGYGWQGRPVLAYANVFCAEKLDPGARCLLDHFPDQLPSSPSAGEPVRIADLGCGNGILGLEAGRRFTDAEVEFFDESYMAIASARHNAGAWQLSDRAAFHCGDGMAGAADGRYHLILCNPPFHQQQVVGDFIARQMFHDARRCLQPGGELWVVGNRHLNYHVALKRLFGQCDTLSGDRKFVILRAVK